MPWTAKEVSLLIGLWPTASAAQISKCLNRSRGSVCGKAMRLRGGGVLPAEVEKHFEVNPAVQTRLGRAQAPITSIMPAPMPPVDASVSPPDMRRCTLLELENGECRWPLGTVAEAPKMFCGGAAGIIGGWRATDVSRGQLAPISQRSTGFVSGWLPGCGRTIAGFLNKHAENARRRSGSERAGFSRPPPSSVDVTRVTVTVGDMT
jgi:GcrA cell cycle regulator